MCEFCTKHGEGKKWYLQMKNYSIELLDADLSAEQRSVVGKDTRFEWNNSFFEAFVLPAMGHSVQKPQEPENVQPPPEIVKPKPTEQERVRRRQIEHFGQVLPIEEVEKVIDMTDSITRMPCGCRYVNTGLTDKRYCFGLGLDKWGILGKYPEAAASLEVLNKAEARKIFRQLDNEGLMHSIWTGVTPYVIGICNCDRDCGAYKGYIEMRGSPSFFRAEYICQVDFDRCTGCKDCMSQCQFGSQFYSSALGKVYIDPTRCFGCGVCRAACPNEAIDLLPREKSAEAADLWLREAG